MSVDPSALTRSGTFPPSPAAAPAHHLGPQDLAGLLEQGVGGAAINDGDDDVSRLGSSPAWAVLMMKIEHQQQAAA